MPSARAAFSLGISWRTVFSSTMVLMATQCGIAQLRDRGIAKRRKRGDNIVEIVAADVEQQADAAIGLDRAVEQHRQAVDFFALPGVFPGGAIGDEPRGGFKKRVDDAQAIGAQRRAGFGDFDDGVGELGNFYFRGAPGKFDARFHAVAFEIFFGHAHGFGGDDFAFEVFHGVDGGIFGDGENPAHAAEARLRINEFGDFLHVGAGFDDPVISGKAAIETAVLDVARHFLRADKHAFDFRIVDGGIIAAGADGNAPAGAREKLDGRILQASFGNAEFQRGHYFVPFP